MDEGEDGSEQAGGGGGLDPELIRSYLNFGKRALRPRRWMIALLFVCGLALTVAAYKYLPRTYSCTTILMVESSQVLEGNSNSNGLTAAETLIMRHENLEQIIRDTDLIAKYKAHRPAVLALKDRIVYAVLGQPSQETMMAVLRGTLESKLGVKVEQGTLQVSVDWFDPKTAAEIVEAARESYVKSRHVAEMSAFEEKLAILDGHAASLRDEIESLVKQARALIKERTNNAKEALRAAAAANAVAEGDVPVLPTRPRATTSDAVDAEGPRIKEALEQKRRQLADFQRDHDQRVLAEQQKLDDLKLKLTPSHPEVVTQQRRLAIAQQDSSEVALLRAEIQSLEGELKQHDVLSRHDSGGGTRSVARGKLDATIDPLPTDVVQLLDTGNIDPALAAQLGSAISKYGALRDDIRSGRIQFDTAQAAFNFRYKVVVPADPPTTPTKPKAAVVLGAGFFLSLLVAFVLPILLQLRSGMVVERWQVAALQLPVLADLRLPPAAREPESDAPPASRA
jgi:uncharacterized protein involved in exopolysaccharide biosynthesis